MKYRFYKLFSFISIYSLYGLMFFIPISISFIEIFSTLLLFGFIGRKIIKPEFKFIKLFPNIFLLLFVFFSAISLLNSGAYIRISIYALFIKWVRYLMVCVILQDFFYDDKIVKRSILILLSGAFLVILSGLSQYFFGFEFIYRHPLAVTNCGLHAMTSSFNYYNDFGTYLIVVLLLTLTLLSSDDCFGAKVVALLIFSMVTSVVIMLTFSRGSWVAMMSSFIIVLIFCRKNIWRIIPVFIVVASMLFIPEIRKRIYSIFEVDGDAFRFTYWKSALNMIKEHPFLGVGVGTFMANYLKYMPDYPLKHIAYAHNCFLQIWAESGIFSLVSFLLFIGSLFYIGIRKFIDSRNFMLLGLLTGILGYFINSFFDTNLYSLQLAVLLWVLVGIILGICHSPRVLSPEL